MVTWMLAAVAHATTGLAWQFDAPVRYELGVAVYFPQAVFIRAAENREARAIEIDVHLVTTCTPVGPLGKGWQVRCRIDDLALGALAIAPDAGRLDPIVAEWDTVLTGATVELALQSNGRIKVLDLEGVPKGNDRLSEIQETMRQVLRRAFALIDLELPKKGDDKGRGEWRQGTALAMEFPTAVGTLGSAALQHRITGTNDGVVTLSTAGKGTIGSAETVSVRGNEQIRDLFEATLEGTATFDTARGRLVERQYLFEATPTASSAASQGARGFPYVQAARLVLLEDGQTVDLGVSGEIDPDARQ